MTSAPWSLIYLGVILGGLVAAVQLTRDNSTPAAAQPNAGEGR